MSSVLLVNLSKKALALEGKSKAKNYMEGGQK